MVNPRTGLPPVKSERRSENGQDLSALDRGSHQLQWNEPIEESENKKCPLVSRDSKNGSGVKLDMKTLHHF